MEDWYVCHDTKTKLFEAKKMNKQGIYFTVPINEDVIRKELNKEKALIYAKMLNKQSLYLNL